MKSSASESKPFQSRSRGEIPAWARRKERLSRFKLKRAFLIDSDAELFIYIIECIRFGSWKVRQELKDPLGADLLDATAFSDPFTMRLNVKNNFIVPTVLRWTWIKFGRSRNIDDVDPAILLYQNALKLILRLSMTYSSGFSTGDPDSKLTCHN